MNTPSPRILAATAALAAALVGAVAPAQAADTFVNLSVGGQLSPGVYGMVNVGNAAPPPVVYAQPIVAVPPPVAVAPLPPAYLYVPPGHRKHWKQHCAYYNACGRPVYFVNVDSRARYVYPRGYGPAVVAPPPGRGYERYDRDRDHDHDRGHGRGRDWDHDRR